MPTLLPRTFPLEVSALPWKLASTFMSSWGSEAPIEASVRPITMSEAVSWRAMAPAPWSHGARGVAVKPVNHAMRIAKAPTVVTDSVASAAASGGVQISVRDPHLPFTISLVDLVQ